MFIEGRRPLAISNGCDCRVGLQKGQIGNSGDQKTDQMLKFLVNSRIDYTQYEAFLLDVKDRQISLFFGLPFTYIFGKH